MVLPVRFDVVSSTGEKSPTRVFTSGGLET